MSHSFFRWQIKATDWRSSRKKTKEGVVDTRGSDVLSNEEKGLTLILLYELFQIQHIFELDNLSHTYRESRRKRDNELDGPI